MTALTGPSEVEVVTPARPAGRLQHLPALDGLRGLAVVAVLLFHGGFDWAKGGWLGVSVFFTLSGFLITNLLVAEWAETDTISLRTFWSRRFRRLMPAAVATLLLIAFYGWVFASPEQLRNLRIDLLAGLGYVANWRFLLADISYADLFTDPSPVQHFWSLAIEEQFYVVYPLVVFGALRVGGRRALTILLAVTVTASVVWAYVERANLDRVYYGADTRMAELLAGSLFALWWSASPAAREIARGRWRQWAVLVIGVAGLVGSLALWPSVDQASRWVTRGVLPLQTVLSVALIATGARPGIISRVLSWTPLTSIGLISYGLYLYHWPVFLVLDEDRTDLSLVPLFALRVTVTLGAALLSYALLEQPIRRRRVLLMRRAVRTAVVGGILAVVLTAVAVTWSPPRTSLAHADVDLDDARITVDTVAPDEAAEPPVATPLEAPDSIMIIGDSGTYDAAPGIGAAFKSLGTTTVVDATFPGFGLTRDPSAWREGWPRVLAEHDPRLVIVMLGGWDAAYVDDRGKDAYDEVLDEVVGVLTSRGANILWLGLLPGPDTDTESMNARFEELPERHPGDVAFARIDESLQGPGGGYPRWIPDEKGDLVLARKPDGWHLCPGGAARLARSVTDITAWLGLSPRPSPGWEFGEWILNPRYDDPVDGCDPDHGDNQPD